MDIMHTMQAMEDSVNAVTSPAVKIWLNWMLSIFLCSVLFVWTRKTARYVLLAFVVSAVVGVITFYYTENPHILGISHIIVWLPLLIYILKTQCGNPKVKLKSFYGIWLALLSLTIVISLVFDFRDVSMVLMGMK